MPNARTAWLLARQTVREFFSFNGVFLAAGLAFYVVLYCFPLLLLLVTALGYTLVGSASALTAVQAMVERLVPASQFAVMRTLSEVVEHRGQLGAIAAATFFLFGSFLFGAVRHVLNTVFGVTQRRTLLRGLGADLVAMLGTGSLLAVTMGLAAALAILFDFARRLPSLDPYIGAGWVLMGRLLGVVFTWSVLYLLYRVAPARTIGRRGLVVAAVGGVLLLELSKWLFGWYVEGASGYAVLYGALGGLIFFVLWIYYACVVFVLAGTLGVVVDREQSL